MAELKIPDGELGEWLQVLKKYQRDQIEILIKDTEPERAAEMWVTTIGHSNIAHFGGIPNTQPFWQMLKAEFYDFICGTDAYKKEKEELAQHGEVGKMLLVSTMSSAIGAQIGVTAVVIVPALVLLLFAAGKMGVNAYCKLPRPALNTEIKAPPEG